VIHRSLVLTALGCCGLVLASFALFARDQIAGASKHQQNALVAGAPASTPPPAVRHHVKGQPRRFIDGAARTLTSPFDSIVHSDNQWVLHGVPLMFALLLYGVGIGYLARYSRGLS
jgi:hypothetical protein